MESPYFGLRIAGPNDHKELLPFKVNMDFKWNGYLNQKVLDAVGTSTTGRLTHVQCHQDVTHGYVYLVAAKEGDYGAEAIDYSDTENGAKVSLYTAMLPFKLERQKGRVRNFDLEYPEVQAGVKLLALNVRGSKLIPGKARKKSNDSDTTTNNAAKNESKEAANG